MHARSTSVVRLTEHQVAPRSFFDTVRAAAQFEFACTDIHDEGRWTRLPQQETTPRHRRLRRRHRSPSGYSQHSPSHGPINLVSLRDPTWPVIDSVSPVIVLRFRGMGPVGAGAVVSFSAADTRPASIRIIPVMMIRLLISYPYHALSITNGRTVSQ